MPGYVMTDYFRSKRSFTKLKDQNPTDSIHVMSIGEGDTLRDQVDELTSYVDDLRGDDGTYKGATEEGGSAAVIFNKNPGTTETRNQLWRAHAHLHILCRVEQW
jgi:hypothetical protein